MATTYESLDQGGHKRVFSLHKRDWVKYPPGTRKVFAGVHEILPRDQWPKDGVDLSDEDDRTLNQGSLSLCHSYATTGAHETALKLSGFPGILLSPDNLAGQVTNGQDTGAGVVEPWEVLQTHGQCLQSMVQPGDYHPRDWPANWRQNALLYITMKIWDMGQGDNVIEAIVTALIRRRAVTAGTLCFGGGHDVHVVGYSFVNGKLFIKIHNSWGDDWTNCKQGGFGMFSEQKFSNGLSDFGAVGCEAVIVPPGGEPEAVK